MSHSLSSPRTTSRQHDTHVETTKIPGAEGNRLKLITSFTININQKLKIKFSILLKLFMKNWAVCGSRTCASILFSVQCYYYAKFKSVQVNLLTKSIKPFVCKPIIMAFRKRRIQWLKLLKKLKEVIFHSQALQCRRYGKGLLYD